MQDAAVVHNVAGLAADWGPREVFRNVNVAGVRNVMETALQHGVRRVVHISSVSVYGFPGGTDIDENSVPIPRADNPYITTKAEGETLALSYRNPPRRYSRQPKTHIAKRECRLNRGSISTVTPECRFIFHRM